MERIKSQAAVDFMTSYGVALIIIIIAMAVIYKVGFLNSSLTPVSCTGFSGFSCGAFAINSSGVLSIYLYQATGGKIIINAISCSSAINASGDKPAYGNFYVTDNSIFYPPGNAIPSNGIPLYSGSGTSLVVNCYDSAGIATGSLGSAFFGYVWLNYTVPGYATVTREVATFTSKYT